MNFRRGRSEDLEQLNVIPLIDVLLILLIFFMVSTTFQTETQLHIQLPEAQQGAREQPLDPLEIVISADGQYAVDGRTLIDNQRSTLLDALARATGEGKRPVILRADARTPHQAVVKAMDVAAQLGVGQLSIATARDPAVDGTPD